jgi:hypothetical protein
MSKFNGSQMIATFGTWGLDGLTSVELASNADVTEQAISGQTYKAQIVGVPAATFTINMLLDNATPVPGSLLTALTPGNTGPFTFDPIRGSTFGGAYAGTGLVRQRDVSYPVEGFVALSLQVGIDGALSVFST